jgi:hypothetical protein
MIQIIKIVVEGKFSGWQIVADLQLQMSTLYAAGLRVPEK